MVRNALAGMRCELAPRDGDLRAVIDSELGGLTHLDLAEHVRACEECRDRAQALRATSALVRGRLLMLGPTATAAVDAPPFDRLLVAKPRTWLSLVVPGGVVDVATASKGRFGPDPQSIFSEWSAFRAWAGSSKLEARQPLVTERLQCPVPQPRQVFGVGLNYRAHAAEANLPVPDRPAVFTKSGLVPWLNRFELSLPRRFDAEGVMTVSTPLAERFQATMPAGSAAIEDIVRAFDKATERVLRDLVTWTLVTGAAARAAG